MKGDSDISFCESSVEALGLLAIHKYQLIVFPLEMKDVDGVSLAKNIRLSQGINRATSMVIITSEVNLDLVIPKDALPDLVLQKNSQMVEKFDEFLNDVPKLETHKTNILFIDDDKFVQKMVKVWFKKVDFLELTQCFSVEELSNLPNLDFDLIVSDNLLPDGELAEILSVIENSSKPGVPVLVYTGSVEKIDGKAARMRANILDILPKPFDMGDLLGRVEKLRSKT